MAELGVIASAMGIASLVIQVGDSLLKLKAIWDGVKEAPGEIGYLVQEAETLKCVLSEIHRVQSEEQNLMSITSESTQKCLTSCREAVGILEAVVRDLEDEVSRRRLLGGLRVVLKTGTINKLSERLRHAQSVLMLSRQVYSDAIQKRRHDIQLYCAMLQYQELTAVKASLAQLTCQSQSNGQSPRDGKSAFGSRRRLSQRQRRFIARVRAPTWVYLFSHALEFCGYQSRAGWMFTFRTYNIVPFEASILEYVKDGDIKSVQRLFSERKASPFDRTVAGFTLLDIAAQFHQLEICRLLISEDADPNVSAYDSFMQAPCIPNLFVKAVKARANRDFFELIRCLTDGTDFEVFAEENSFTDRGAYEVLTWLMEQYTFDRTALPKNKCWTIELSIAKLSFQPNMASLFRTAMKGRKMDDMVRGQPLRGRFLLQCVAQNLGEYCAASYFSRRQRNAILSNFGVASNNVNNHDDRWNEDERAHLLSLTHDLVTAGSELHWLNFFRRTPLLSIFCWFVQFPNPYEPGDSYCRMLPGTPTADMKQELPASLLIPVRLWLEQLRSAGVDLEEYGRKEHNLHIEKPELVARECFYVWHKKGKSRLTRCCTICRLISFTYGPSPDDWRFWMMEWMDDSFRDFWEMVDHPERAIPGAWNGTESHSYACDLPASRFIDFSQGVCSHKRDNTLD